MGIYKDSARTVDERVKDLLTQMTIKEKIGQLNQRMLGWNAYKIVGSEVVLSHEFIDEVAFGEGLGAVYGLSRADGWNSNVTMGVTTIESVHIANTVQKYIIDNTRLGIPVLIAEECPHGHEALEGTTFPTNIGIGSTWNVELYERVCSTIAKELRARGGHLGLISTLDIATDPRWGRTEECFSEDPYLSSLFCEKAVTGLQGKNPEELKDNNRVVSVLKHFCGQGATIGGHNGKSTNIGQRELHEIHLQGMRRGAAAGSLGCMAAYNDIDGVPCHINPNLLTDILRKEMGFKGFVISDGKGVDRLLTITGTLEKAGAEAVRAGVDLNLWNDAFLVLESAIQQGMLEEEVLDIAVERILRVKFMLGLFENPYITEELALATVGSADSKAVALDIAREVPVLLENKNNVLPIGKDIRQIAVIGPNSNNIYNQLGDYTQWQEDGKVVTVLEGIKKHAPEDVKVVWAQGCSVRGMDTTQFDEAICVAKASNVIVLVLGGSSTREVDMTFEDNGAVFMDKFTSEIDCGEAVDLADIELGGVQVALAKEMKKLGKPIITVLIQGRPHAVSWLKENSEGLLCAWYPGERGGDAVGEIIFGKTVPSGKLSVSVPISSAQLPVYYNCKDQTNYIDISAKPLYPFGYGLSYTAFECADFTLNHQSITKEKIIQGERFVISFKVRNTGLYDGKEVLQLYIYDMESCITRRLKELKDFAKVFVEKDGCVDVSLSVGYKELGIYNYKMDFELEPGNIRLMVGNSSDNIVFETVVVIEG